MKRDGVGGSRENQRKARPRRWSRSLPIAFLVVSLGVAGFGALEAYSAQRAHEATATGLLEDYGEAAAWNFERASGALIATAINHHLEIVHKNRMFAAGQATKSGLMQILEPDTGGNGSCTCATRVAGRYSFFTRLGDSVSESVWNGAMPSSAHQSAVVDAVQIHAREVYPDRAFFAVLHVTEAEGAPIVAYARVAGEMLIGDDFKPARDTLVYGFEIDRRLLEQLYAKALAENALLPPTLTRGRPNDEIISVQVYGPDASLLYASAPESEMAYAAPIGRRPLLGGGEVRASVLPDIAPELIIGGLPKDRTGTLALVFALASALAVLAIVQIRREDQLALLRQDFIASVSHELRTPLAQVRLFTETLKLGRTRNDDQRGWALDNIDRETQRLSALVENILHFSRAERGAQQLNREPADVGAEVRGAIESFAPLLPPQKGRIQTDVPDDLIAEVHSDSIRQIVLNLLDNAVRYGPRGQTIRVRGESDGRRVRIFVDDEGPGVPLDERERIFEPFQRGDQSVGTVVVGSGIGLAVVHGIIKAHEGRVWVTDAPGGGARFVFELPALHTALPEHFASEAVERRSATGAA